MTTRHPVWFFDLDDTLHDASGAAFGPTSQAMTDYIARHLDLPHDEATALRQHYWRRYGATLLGLVRHHGVKADHFLEETHRLPGLEQRLRTSAHDRAALRCLRGRKFVLTNAPRAYAYRVLNALNLTNCFDGVISIEDMHMFGGLRPKPDARMFRHLMAKLKVSASRCILVEDTLQHQRTAWGLGMRTVWMKRYLHRNVVNNVSEVGIHQGLRPPYVYARIHSLQFLQLVTTSIGRDDRRD